MLFDAAYQYLALGLAQVHETGAVVDGGAAVTGDVRQLLVGGHNFGGNLLQG